MHRRLLHFENSFLHREGKIKLSRRGREDRDVKHRSKDISLARLCQQQRRCRCTLYVCDGACWVRRPRPLMHEYLYRVGHQCAVPDNGAEWRSGGTGQGSAAQSRGRYREKRVRSVRLEYTVCGAQT
eukprot:2145331-Rhodomonas_salina.3